MARVRRCLRLALIGSISVARNTPIFWRQARETHHVGELGLADNGWEYQLPHLPQSKIQVRSACPDLRKGLDAGKRTDDERRKGIGVDSDQVAIGSGLGGNLTYGLDPIAVRLFDGAPKTANFHRQPHTAPRDGFSHQLARHLLAHQNQGFDCGIATFDDNPGAFHRHIVLGSNDGVGEILFRLEMKIHRAFGNAAVLEDGAQARGIAELFETLCCPDQNGVSSKFSALLHQKPGFPCLSAPVQTAQPRHKLPNSRPCRESA